MTFMNVRLSDASGNVGHGAVPMFPADRPLGPVSPTGNWGLVMADDFETFDPDKWIIQDGRDMNGVLSKASNVSVANSFLKLQLSAIGGVVYGAMVSSALDYAPDAGRYMMKRGDVVEAMIFLPGKPTEDILNWGGFWTSGPDWPKSGENDIIEGGPAATINYHGVQSISGGNLANYVSNGSPVPAGNWKNRWIRAALHRTSDNKSKIYWDGQLMRTIDTADRESPAAEQAVIFSLGKSDGTLVTGSAGAILVDWFKAYRPV